MLLTRAQFTMRRMMACISIAAIVLAVARYAVMRWGMEGLTAFVFLLFCTTGNVVPHFRKGPWGLFWAGFGGYGLLYLSVTLGYFNLPVRLPTSELLDVIHDRLPASFPASSGDFHRAGHAAFSLLFGVLVGCLLATQAPARAPGEATGKRPPLRAYFPTAFACWDRLRCRR